MNDNVNSKRKETTFDQVGRISIKMDGIFVLFSIIFMTVFIIYFCVCVHDNLNCLFFLVNATLTRRLYLFEKKSSSENHSWPSFNYLM